MINIVVADDHKIVRQGVRTLIESEPGFNVIGDAPNGQEAVEMVRSLHPDVLVTDLIMPGMNGIEVTRKVRQISPRTKVIILSMYDSDSYVAEALQAGAEGYVLKENGLDELVTAVREAVGGKRYLSPPLSEARVAAYRRRVQTQQVR